DGPGEGLKNLGYEARQKNCRVAPQERRAALLSAAQPGELIGKIGNQTLHAEPGERLHLAQLVHRPDEHIETLFPRGVEKIAPGEIFLDVDRSGAERTRARQRIAG